MPWFKGNLHTHTTNSDGDSAPEVVVAWYRDAGYDFLALTDHDLLTLPADYRSVAADMLLVHGEEVTPGDVHINALGISQAIAPVRAGSVAATLQENVDRIRAAGGVPSVNHPNYRWLVGAADLLGLAGCRLFEVCNGGPETNDAGGVGRASTEELWDAVLTAGRRLIGIAVDDAHHFRVFGHRYANPGRAWVVVEADRLDESALLGAIEAGRLYASTGIELAGVVGRDGRLDLDIVPSGDLAYRTTFIGTGGVVLDVVDGLEPRFRGSPTTDYVRARVEDSDGHRAWIQPTFTD